MTFRESTTFPSSSIISSQLQKPLSKQNSTISAFTVPHCSYHALSTALNKSFIIYPPYNQGGIYRTLYKLYLHLAVFPWPATFGIVPAGFPGTCGEVVFSFQGASRDSPPADFLPARQIYYINFFLSNLLWKLYVFICFYTLLRSKCSEKLHNKTLLN